MQVVIPAGGIGKRFLPLSSVVPKELLLLGDRPVLHHALDEAARAGFEGAIVVAAPWKRPLFEAYIEAAPAPLTVRVVEQPVAAGIGDALLRAAVAAGGRFGVLLPDDVIVEDEHWPRLLAGDGAAVCVRQVPPDQVDRFGIVVAKDGRAERMVEKPRAGSVDSNLAILGRYLVDASVLEALERLAAEARDGELQLTDGHAAASAVRVIEFTGEIFDCGTPDSYLEAAARWWQTKGKAGPEGPASSSF